MSDQTIRNRPGPATVTSPSQKGSPRLGISCPWADESRLLFQFSDGRACVDRRQGELFADVDVVKRLPFRGGSVMVWAGISINHIIPLFVINGNLAVSVISTRLLSLL